MTRVRQLLLGVLALGLAGTFTDLVLLAHYEDVAQLVPLALIVVALATVAWHVTRPDRRNLRALRAVMAACVLAGLAGIGFHLNGSAEFQWELDPSLSWWAVLQKAARAQAPPLLAPGGLLQLGLLGLVYTVGHPLTDAAPPRIKEITK